jgi:hypothetical protein
VDVILNGEEFFDDFLMDKIHVASFLGYVDIKKKLIDLLENEFIEVVKIEVSELSHLNHELLEYQSKNDEFPDHDSDDIENNRYKRLVILILLAHEPLV